MRRVVLQMGVSLDGYLTGPNRKLDWGLPPEDTELKRWKVAVARGLPSTAVGEEEVAAI